MTTIYCDNKGCTFQAKDQCIKPYVTLHDSALLPPAPFLRLCRSYEKRNLTSKCSGPQESRGFADPTRCKHGILMGKQCLRCGR